MMMVKFSNVVHQRPKNNVVSYSAIFFDFRFSNFHERTFVVRSFVIDVKRTARIHRNPELLSEHEELSHVVS